MLSFSKWLMAMLFVSLTCLTLSSNGQMRQMYLDHMLRSSFFSPSEGFVVTHEQALVAITYDAAWQCYAEQWTGSLKAVNFADFVVLAQDPLTMKDPYMHMRNIGVLETWVAGSLVYGSTVSQKVSMA